MNFEKKRRLSKEFSKLYQGLNQQLPKFQKKIKNTNV